MKNLSTSNNLRLEVLLITLVSVLAGLVFFAHIGDYALFNPDEGLYAEPAREMLETGQYITTTLNYAIRFTKPPLIIWAMAICYKVFGVNEFAARIFCAASGFLLTIITYLFANKYLGRRIALFCAAMLLTSPLFIGIGHMAITDMPLSLFTAGALFSFFHGWKQKQTFWIYIGYLLIAFAVMTKGPVGLLLPSVILVSFFFLIGQAKSAAKFFQLPLGLLIVAVIALPWFVIEIIATHGAYFQEFIMRENFARFTTIVDSHKGPWWYHIAVIFGGLFPWSILLPQALSTIFKNIKATELSNKDSNGSKILSPFSRWLNCYRHLTDTNQLLLFTLIWSVIIITFYSISVSKLLPYTLPAFPALAIMIAYQWEMLLEAKERKSIFVYSIILILIYMAAIFLCPTILKHLRNSPPELVSVLYQYCSLISLSIFISLLLLIGRHKLLSSAMLFSTITLVIIVFIPQLLSVLSQSWEQTISQYARFAGYSHQPLIVYRLRKPSLPFYFGHRVIQPTDQQDLIETAKNSKQCYLITSTKYLPEVESAGYKIIDRDNNFAFFVLSK